MLNSPVLVLNRSWMPLQVANVRRTITLLFKGHAEVVCPTTYRTFAFDQWKLESELLDDMSCLHTPHFRMAVPEIVVLRNFNRTIHRKLRFNRKNIFLRDQNVCQYCGVRLPTKELTLEHIIPVSKGGESSWENVVLACRRCNNHKANRTPEQAGMKLIREPKKPDFLPQPLSPQPRESWTPFLSRHQSELVAVE